MNRLVVVVPEATKGAALSEMKKLDPTGGDKALTPGLSATGAAPATHFWCSWAMTAQQDTELRGYLAGTGQNPHKPVIYDGNLVTSRQVLTELGLKRVEVAE